LILHPEETPATRDITRAWHTYRHRAPYRLTGIGGTIVGGHFSRSGKRDPETRSVTLSTVKVRRSRHETFKALRNSVQQAVYRRVGNLHNATNCGSL
jgi:hypothetical protein